MITIELPVPAYLHSYLTTVYGKDYKVSATDDLGILILNVLSKKYDYYKYNREYDKNSSRYTITMSISTLEKHGCNITQQKINQINKHIDSSFRTSLFRAAIINKEYFNIQYKETINAILNSFNIDEADLSYSTIRKDFNRKKNSIASYLEKDKFKFFKN